MTLKDYLDKRLTELEEGANTPLIEGKIMAFSEIYKRLDEFDHEPDLERISDECKKAVNCRECPLCDEDGACVIYDEYPNYWELDDIKRRLKEAR